MIEFSGALDQATYVRALRLAGASPRILGFILVGGGAAAFFAFGVLERPTSWGVPLFITCIGAYVLLAPLLAARRALRTSSILKAPFTGYADEAMFQIESVHGRSSLKWETFYRAVVGPDLVLLYTSAQLFHIVSRVFFASDDEWSRFRELVRAGVRQSQPRYAALKAGILWFLIVITAFVAWSMWHAAKTR